uniref:Uncharacterized protein n=1 Tax=Globisporangium ultimum (strain ATCC 200006 / CBS 805.95 / DAOM BR144) TaxID=431595 RepID=K3WLQ2_GLOUD
MRHRQCLLQIVAGPRPTGKQARASNIANSGTQKVLLYLRQPEILQSLAANILSRVLLLLLVDFEQRCLDLWTVILLFFFSIIFIDLNGSMS